MLETPHVLVASAIAVKIQQPYLSIPLAFASHFIFDMYPHWNPHIYRETKKFGKPKKSSINIIMIDVGTALIVGTLAATTQLPNYQSVIVVYLAAFAAVLPDVVQFPFYFLNMEPHWLKGWVKFKRSIQNDISMFWGILTQLVVCIAAFYWIFS